MNRRQFSASTSGFLASLLLPKFQRIREIDLSLFCGETAGKYDLSRPFLQNGNVYATEGCIALQLSSVSESLAGEGAVIPDAARLGWADRDSVGWTPIDRLVRANRDYCGCLNCFGRGRVGSGVHECECVDYYEVHCDCMAGYVGGKQCQECSGSGTVDYCLELGDMQLNPDYIGRLRTIQGVEVKQVPCEVPVADFMLAARFPQGSGLLMPLFQE